MATTLVQCLRDRGAERTSRCDIGPLQQVGAPDLAPVVFGEVAEDAVFCDGVGQHVFLGLVQERSGLAEALRQRGGQIIPAALDLRSGFMGEHAGQGSRDHALVGLRLRRRGSVNGDLQRDVAHLGRPGAREVAVTVAEPLLAAFAMGAQVARSPTACKAGRRTRRLR